MDQPCLPPTLQSACIPSLPPSAYYIPNFITEREENLLLHKINTAPLPTWKHLSHRRLQALPSPLSASNTLLAAPLPSWLAEPVLPRLLSLPLAPGRSQDHVFARSPHAAPNHCLINEYLPGQGIHAHEDGLAYHPVVVTVSLGSHVVLDVFPKRGGAGRREEEGWRVLQERRSLLVTTGECYTECLHGIGERVVDEGMGAESVANWGLLGNRRAFETGRRERSVRVSLTFRDVVKVRNLGKAFGALGRSG